MLRKRGKYWHCQFDVHGVTYWGSTRETSKTRAETFEALKKADVRTGVTNPFMNKAPLLRDFAPAFLKFNEERERAGSIDSDTERCYRNGGRLLEETAVAGIRLDRIRNSDAEALSFPGGPSNANQALRTLRRILSLARDRGIIRILPRIKLREENERSAIYSPEQESAFLEVAEQPLRDVFLISHDSGLRPDEVIRMRWENVLWDKNLIFNPDGKTAKARRHVPLSDRVRALLTERALSATSKWVFPSPRKKETHISHGPIAKQFGMARKAAALPTDLVLYSARHSFGTDMIDRTGNIALVQKLMGHESITTTQRYLHPEIKGVAALVNLRNAERKKNAEAVEISVSGGV